MNILVVVAHPDDETLGAGGTIAKLVKAGNEVHVCILADGVMARPDNVKEIERQKECARKACGILGVADIAFLGFGDQRLDTYPILEITKEIEKKVKLFQPDIVYTHHYGDLNMDHRIVFEATMVACRPFGSVVRQIFCFETPSSTEWNAPSRSPFLPTTYENVEETFEFKVKALREYSKTVFDEVKEFPYPRSEEAILSLAKLRGSAVGFKRAEAFMLIRELRG